MIPCYSIRMRLKIVSRHNVNGFNEKYLIIIVSNYMMFKHSAVNIHFMFHIHFRDIKLITFIGQQALLSLEFHQCQIKNKAFKCIHIYHKTCLRFNALKALKPIYIYLRTHIHTHSKIKTGAMYVRTYINIYSHDKRGVVPLCANIVVAGQKGSVCVCYVRKHDNTQF